MWPTFSGHLQRKYNEQYYLPWLRASWHLTEYENVKEILDYWRHLNKEHKMTLYDTYMLPLKVAYIIYFLKGVNWPRNKLLIN